MGIDRVEASRRGQQTSAKATSHPFIALDHRVIDSAAFADLKHSSVRVLLTICRQLKKDNNGHLQATYSWCKRFGIGSDNTLADAVADLIAHGFIYRTKSHGANGVWAKYAVTWLPIKKSEGLFLYAFKAFAWRDWQPSEKKTSPQKSRSDSRKNCVLSGESTAETAGSHTAISADYEPMLPWYGPETPHADHAAGGWIYDYLVRLAGRGLARDCPVTLVQPMVGIDTLAPAKCEL